MAETAPRPLFRTLHQPSPHRIAMDVTQLFRLLGVAPYVEIVIARLPQRTSLRLPQPPRHVLLQHLQRDRKFRSLRLGQQQMNMLRHDDISGNVETVPFPRVFEGLLKDVSGVRRAQTWRTPIAAKRHEMQAAGFLVSLEAPGHLRIVAACALSFESGLAYFSVRFQNREVKTRGGWMERMGQPPVLFFRTGH